MKAEAIVELLLSHPKFFRQHRQELREVSNHQDIGDLKF
jgi:uncharacterized protein YigA (DUF484 family)